MSYDDGRTQDRRLIEIFNQYGIKGTFHLNSGLFDRGDRILPEEIKSLYAGHEVACQRYGFSGRAKPSEEPTTRE